LVRIQGYTPHSRRQILYFRRMPNVKYNFTGIYAPKINQKLNKTFLIVHSKICYDVLTNYLSVEDNTITACAVFKGIANGQFLRSSKCSQNVCIIKCV